jgi:hypothetical protein
MPLLDREPQDPPHRLQHPLDGGGRGRQDRFVPFRAVS